VFVNAHDGTGDSPAVVVDDDSKTALGYAAFRAVSPVVTSE